LQHSQTPVPGVLRHFQQISLVGLDQGCREVVTKAVRCFFYPKFSQIPSDDFPDCPRCESLAGVPIAGPNPIAA
jgi:hypothetical protein